jgi:hypothetical protein
MVRSKHAVATHKHDKPPTTVERKRNRLEEIFQGCQFRNPTERANVARFLMKHKFLIPVILEAFPKIQNFFGDETVALLSLVVDPEDEDFQELFISIVTDRPIDEALDLLDQFDEEWFLDVLPETKNLLNVTIEAKNAF